MLGLLVAVITVAIGFGVMLSASIAATEQVTTADESMLMRLSMSEFAEIVESPKTRALQPIGLD